MFGLFKNNSYVYSEYPSSVLLNNALRYLLKNHIELCYPIEEIVTAMGKAQAQIDEDVLDLFDKARGYWKAQREAEINKLNEQMEKVLQQKKAKEVYDAMNNFYESFNKNYEKEDN